MNASSQPRVPGRGALPGSYHASARPPLIDQPTFTDSQDLLAGHGDGKAACRSNSYDYILSSQLFCAMSGKRYVGAAALGRSGRYECHVCVSRQQYGSAGYTADRLPARELEDSMLAGIGSAYSDAAIDRYLAAFEDGSSVVEFSSNPSSRQCVLRSRRTVLALLGPLLARMGPMIRVALERIEALELLGMTLAHLNDAEAKAETSPRVPLLMAIRDKLALGLREEL
ncbi:MAG: hypothetical protein ACYDDZ_01255 [Acidimicrobiales bacterium]